MRCETSFLLSTGRAAYTASTNVPNLSTLHDIVQGSHNFLSGGVTIQSMDLQDIDICAQPGNTLVHCIENVLPAQSNLIDHISIINAGFGNWKLLPVLADTKITFGQNNHLVSGNVVLLDGLSNNLLGFAVRVYVCGVPSVQPDIVCMLQEGQSFILVDNPVLPFRAPDGHAAKDNLGDLQARLSQAGVLHLWLSFAGHVDCMGGSLLIPIEGS